VLSEWEHFSRNVMVSVGVSRTGKTRVVFIDPGAKVNSSYDYSNIVLEKGLLPEQYVVITGGHCSRMERQRTPPGPRRTFVVRTFELCRYVLWKKEHINFIEPHMWPPNSPDINPVDYAIWGAFQQRVYHQRQFKTVEELQRTIVTEWQKLSAFRW